MSLHHQTKRLLKWSLRVNASLLWNLGYISMGMNNKYAQGRFCIFDFCPNLTSKVSRIDRVAVHNLLSQTSQRKLTLIVLRTLQREYFSVKKCWYSRGKQISLWHNTQKIFFNG